MRHTGHEGTCLGPRAQPSLVVFCVLPLPLVFHPLQRRHSLLILLSLMMRLWLKVLLRLLGLLLLRLLLLRRRMVQELLLMWVVGMGEVQGMRLLLILVGLLLKMLAHLLALLVLWALLALLALLCREVLCRVHRRHW